jgi:hypothetical protein
VTELQRALWDDRGTTLLQSSITTQTARCVTFGSAPQAVMFTQRRSSATATGRRLDLGRSGWFRSFAPRHLERCSHFRLLFYDQLLDVICEFLEFADGAFTPTA